VVNARIKRHEEIDVKPHDQERDRLWLAMSWQRDPIEPRDLLAGRWWRALAKDGLWSTVISDLQTHLGRETGADFVVIWLEIPPKGDWLRISDDIDREVVLPSDAGPGILLNGSSPQRVVTGEITGQYRELLAELGVQGGYLIPLEAPAVVRADEPWRAIIGLGWRGAVPAAPPVVPPLRSALWYLFKQRTELAYTDMIVEVATSLGTPADAQGWGERLSVLKPLMGVDHWSLFRLQVEEGGRRFLAVDAESGNVPGHGQAVSRFLLAHPEWQDKSKVYQAAARRQSLFVSDVEEAFAGIPEPSLVSRVGSAYVIYLGEHPERGIGVLGVYWKEKAGWRRLGFSLQPWEAFRRIATEWWLGMHRVQDAAHDALTGALNRRGFADMWRAEAARWGPGALAFVDVDRFAEVNNRWGHPMGDRVLRTLGEALAGLVKRRGGWVARWGGDEFLLAWPRAQDQCKAEGELGEAIASVLDATAVTEGWPTRVTVSGGVLSWEGPPPPLDRLVEQADEPESRRSLGRAGPQLPVASLTTARAVASRGSSAQVEQEQTGETSCTPSLDRTFLPQ
jgi:diguanylate cyclase (GGDEF)-like protein